MLKELRKEMLQQIDGNYIREHKKESELREEVIGKETGRKIIIKMTNLRWWGAEVRYNLWKMVRNSNDLVLIYSHLFMPAVHVNI